MNKAVWLGFAALITPASFAQPLEYKGLSLGSEEKQVLVGLPYNVCAGVNRLWSNLCYIDRKSCRYETRGMTRAECETKRDHLLDFGGVPANDITLTFLSGRLESISIKVPSRSFEIATRALRGKFGEHTEMTEWPVQTNAGRSLRQPADHLGRRNRRGHHRRAILRADYRLKDRLCI